MRTLDQHRPARAGERGSVLIAAIAFMAVLGVFVVMSQQFRTNLMRELHEVADASERADLRTFLSVRVDCVETKAKAGLTTHPVIRGRDGLPVTGGFGTGSGADAEGIMWLGGASRLKIFVAGTIGATTDVRTFPVDGTIDQAKALYSTDPISCP